MIGSAGFVGGVLLPDGRVFCVPASSTSARIYDYKTNTVSTPTGVFPGGSVLSFGVLLPDGRVFCCPVNSTTARIYDPITDSVSTPAGTYPGLVGGLPAFANGVLLPDGRVFMVPRSNTTTKLFSIGKIGTRPTLYLSPFQNKP